MANIQPTYSFDDPSEEARQYWEQHIKGQDALRQQAQKARQAKAAPTPFQTANPAYEHTVRQSLSQGWSNPAMEGPIFLVPGQPSGQPREEYPGNALMNALGASRPLTMRQAEQQAFQGLPPAYGFQQEMMQAPIIAKMRERAADIYNQSQRNALGAAETLGRNQLGQGELFLKQQLGLGELGVKGGELGLRQQEIEKKYDPKSLVLAAMAQSGKFDPLLLRSYEKAIGQGAPASGTAPVPAGSPTSQATRSDETPLDRLAGIDPDLAMKVRDESDPDKKALMIFQRLGPKGFEANFDTIKELIGEARLKGEATRGLTGKIVSDLTTPVHAVTSFGRGITDAINKGDLAELSRSINRSDAAFLRERNVPYGETWRRNTGQQPNEQDMLNQLIRQKYGL